MDSGAAPSRSSAWASATIASTIGSTSSITGRPSTPGGSVPRAISARQAVRRVDAGEPRVEQPLADAPLLEAVELDRQVVLHLVGEVAEADAEPLAQERPHRVLREAHEVVELEDRCLGGRERTGEERARAPRAGR